MKPQQAENNLLQTALDYVARGWSVIPLQPGGKRPLFSWSEYSERLPTEAEIQAWWGSNPNANIGIITGRISGLVVVDIDTERGADSESLLKKFNTGLVARTQSGGFHCYYKYPKGTARVANSVGADGVDLRADGGYVVAPPSKNKNGSLYSWVSEEATSTWDPALVQRKSTETSPETRDKWLAPMLAGVDSGGRNDACARLTGYFTGKGLPEDVINTLIHQWNRLNDPPLPQKEVDRTVESVFKSAKRNTQAEPETIFDILPLNDYMTKYAQAAVNWTVEEWLPEQTMAFLVSPPGSYKTWLLFDLAVSIAGGTPFLGQYAINRPGPVIIIQQEDFHGQLAERLATIICGKHDMTIGEEGYSVTPPPDLPIYFHPDRRLKFNDQVVMAQLEEHIEAIRPQLVIVDPLYSAASTDDYMAKTAEQMLALKQLRDQYGCSFAIAHHTKKRAESTGAREDLWGSQFLNAFLETGWQIRRKSDTDENILIRRHFKASGAVPELSLKFDISSTTPPYGYSVEITEPEPQEDVVEYLRREGPDTITNIAKACNLHRSTMSRKLTTLEEEGIVVKTEDGKYKVARELPSF